MLSRHTARRGFTLIEVLVAVLLIAILAAVTVPTLKGRVSEGYENSLIQELDNLESAIIAYRQDMGHYPPRLDYLTALPASPTDGCLPFPFIGQTPPPPNSLPSTSGYRGPYVTTPIQSTINTASTGNWAGFVFNGRDTIADTLWRVTSQLVSGTTGDYFAIVVRGPDAATQNDLDLKVDGVAGASTGILRYTSLHDTVAFVIPVKTGSC